MKKMKLNIQLFAGSVSIGTITETTDINTNQSTFSIPATMTTSGQTFNNDDAYMTLQWRYSGGSWTTISKKTFGISTNSSKTKSWSLTLTHEDDGTLPDIQFRVKWYITSSTNGTTGAKTYSPTTIPRASDIDSATGGTTPFSPTIVFTPKSAEFKYILMYRYGSEGLASSGFISPNQTTPYTYNSLTLPNNVFRGVDSETMTITAVLQTFQRDLTLIGEATKTFDIRLNSSVKPTISITRVTEADSTMRDLNWKDTNDNFIYIQNHSKLLITTSTSYISPAATNVLTNISANSQTFNENGYSTFNFTTNELTSSGSKTITATATDSRTRTATATATYNVIAYSNPTIATAQVERCDVNGNVSKDGEYCKISYGASISSCLGKNTPYAVYKVGYRIQDTGDYTYITLGTNADSKSLSGVLFTDGIKSASSSGTKVEFDTDYTWDIQFYVEDAFTETTNVQPLDTGFDLMNFNASGKAMAIGKVSEAGSDEELLEIALPTTISETLSVEKYIKDELVVDSIRSKNMLNLYGFASRTLNGITFTNNGDGSITINGTATTSFGINFVMLKLKAGTYHLSTNASVPNDFYIYDYSGNSGIIANNNTATLTQDYDNVGFDTWINSEVIFNNVTIKPQLEEGSTATTYYPYQNLDTNNLAQAIQQSEFLTLNSGVSVVHYNIFKLSNTISGTIVFQTTNVIGNANVELFNIKEQYRTQTTYYTFCGLGTADWRVQRIGYFYLGKNGNGIVLDQNNSGDCKYAIINFNYQTQD